jgi:hypothetical protein
MNSFEAYQWFTYDRPRLPEIAKKLNITIEQAWYLNWAFGQTTGPRLPGDHPKGPAAFEKHFRKCMRIAGNPQSS